MSLGQSVRPQGRRGRLAQCTGGGGWCLQWGGNAKTGEWLWLSWSSAPHPQRAGLYFEGSSVEWLPCSVTQRLPLPARAGPRGTHTDIAAVLKKKVAGSLPAVPQQQLPPLAILLSLTPCSQCELIDHPSSGHQPLEPHGIYHRRKPENRRPQWSQFEARNWLRMCSNR